MMLLADVAIYPYLTLIDPIIDPNLPLIDPILLADLVMGLRYTTTDPTFLSWGLAPGKSTFASKENGGQWFSKLANQLDGSPPPAGSPGANITVHVRPSAATGSVHVASGVCLVNLTPNLTG